MAPPTYPRQALEFARRMGEAGYRPTYVRGELAKLGYTPSLSTVSRWMDPEVWEAQREANRRAMSGIEGTLPGPKPGKKWTWQRRLDRFRRLAAAGVPVRSATKVMNLDFGLSMTDEQGRYILAGRMSRESTIALLTGGQTKHRQTRLERAAA